MNTSPNSNISAFIDTCMYQGYPETIVDIEYDHHQYLLKEHHQEDLDEIPG